MPKLWNMSWHILPYGKVAEYEENYRNEGNGNSGNASENGASVDNMWEMTESNVNDVIQLADGNYMIVGDYFIAKYDANKNQVWRKSSDMKLQAVDEIQNGEVIVAAKKEGVASKFPAISTSNTAEGYLVKYDASGNVVFTKNSGLFEIDTNAEDGYPDCSDDDPSWVEEVIMMQYPQVPRHEYIDYRDIAVLPNGNIVAAVWTSDSHYYSEMLGWYTAINVLYNSSGELVKKEKVNDGITANYFNKIEVNGDRIMVCGRDSLHVSRIKCYNLDLTVQWEEQGDGFTSHGLDVAILSDGNCMGLNYGVYASLTKYDTNGNEIFTKEIKDILVDNNSFMASEHRLYNLSMEVDSQDTIWILSEKLYKLDKEGNILETHELSNKYTGIYITQNDEIILYGV